MKEKMPHILNAASNLLGFCFFVLVSMKTLVSGDDTIIDEVLTGSMLLLAISIFFSFLSIRHEIQIKAKKYETIADYAFFASILSIVFIAVFLFFSIG